MLDLRTEENAVYLPVKVVPGASRTQYIGELDGRAKIAVAAPPEKGKANQAVEKLLAKMLGIRKQDVNVVVGMSSPIKLIRINRVDAATVHAAFQSD